MKEFNTGQVVKVTNKGRTYDTYKKWAKEVGFKGFKSGAMPENGDVGQITIKQKCSHNEQWLYVVEINNQGYIMDSKGIELVDDFKVAFEYRNLRTGIVYQFKAFNLIDIYKCDPDKEFFIALMQEWYPGDDDIDNLDCDPGQYMENSSIFMEHDSLVKNIPWLEKHGFCRLKQTEYLLCDFSYLLDQNFQSGFKVGQKPCLIVEVWRKKKKWQKVTIIEEGLKIPTTSSIGSKVYLDTKISFTDGNRTEQYYTKKAFLSKL